MFRKTRTKLKLEVYSLKNKTGQFFRVKNQRKDSYDLSDNPTLKASMELHIMLDSEEKLYSAKVYGVIDAIGTLGGVHDIVLWCILFLYGSLRKNVYLFSIINRLIQTEQLQDTTEEDNKEPRDGNQIPMSTHDQEVIHNRNRLNNNQVHNYTPIHRSERETRPTMF